MRRASILAALAASLCLATPAAQAAQSARLHVTFTPNRLGGATTVTFDITIAAPPDSVPPPLTVLEVRYPGNLGIAVSGLGLTTCPPTTLEAAGVEACPADSRMGLGSALVEIQVGPEIERETAAVTIIRAPEHNGQFALLFYAEALSPVSAQLVIPGLLRQTQASGNIHLDIPLVPSLPDTPDVAIAKLHATIGPRGLTYYEHVRGKIVPYHPRGILLPDHCPRGGFPFAASLTFEDRSHASASTKVPCPAHREPTPNLRRISRCGSPRSASTLYGRIVSRGLATERLMDRNRCKQPISSGEIFA